MRTEDGRIIYECLNGDSASFGLLVDKYKASIYALAYSRLHNFHDAEDVAQEVFLKAYRNLRTLRRWDSFLVWIRSMTINLCKNRIRAQSRRPDGESIEDQKTWVLEKASADLYSDEQSSIYSDEALDSLQKGLKSLPVVYQQILTLHYLSGMNGEQMSQFLGISHANVRQRLSRARRQLREEILAMMSPIYGQQRLQSSFTFRIVETVKRINVNPIPRTAGLPWGLSLAAGIIITVLSLNPHLNITNDIAFPAGSQLPMETSVLKTGDIPADILRTSDISVISSKQGGGDGGKPHLKEPHNALMLAPQDEAGTWVKKADMPTARSFLSTCEVNEKIYAIGGLIGSNVNTAALEEYDPVTEKWTERADMPTRRNSMGAAVVNGKIYVMGGVNADTCDLSTVEEYDPVKDKWTKKANMPTARLGLSACAVNGKIYAIGGYACGDVILKTVEEYDPVNDTWARKADMPTRRVRPCASVVNGKIYAIGGGNVQRGNADYDGLSVVEEYDPATDTWTEKSDMPTPRWGLSTSVLDDKIYAIGGGDRQVPSNIVEVYDPATDTWAKKPDMPTARGGLSTSVVNGKIYGIGGGKGREILCLTVVEEYDPEAISAVKKNVELKWRFIKTWGGIKAN